MFGLAKSLIKMDSFFLADNLIAAVLLATRHTSAI